MKLTPDQEYTLCRLFETDSARFYFDVTRVEDYIVKLTEELHIKNIVGNESEFIRVRTEWEKEDMRLLREKCIANEIAENEDRHKGKMAAWEEQRGRDMMNWTP